jgi:small-conductance mechanosensitive channel
MRISVAAIGVKPRKIVMDLTPSFVVEDVTTSGAPMYLGRQRTYRIPDRAPGNRYRLVVHTWLLELQITAVDDPTDSSIQAACGDDPRYLCEQVLERTNGNETLARLSDWLIDRPVTILFIICAAWFLTWLERRAVERLVTRVVASDRTTTRRHLLELGVTNLGSLLGETDPEEEARMNARRASRAKSISGVLGSTLYAVIWTIAIGMILGELGLNLGPLLAGAGIVGVALGFGAQSLVNDCISGLFMLVEDQYGIGDVVDLGEAVGIVEEIALRTTVLRGIDGTVWHVPNGEIQRVGNQSQHYSVALIDIDVAYDADIAAASKLMQATATTMCATDEWSDLVLDPPDVLGIENLGADGITLRMTVITAPGQQWMLQRALREALKSAFDDAGIEIPFPQRTVWLRNQEA